MAESDEEVDVEDVSDGEQTTNLRVFGDDDQKDKWYDKDIGNQSFFNSPSLPFSSEYCDANSWLLDTNSVWSLDPCTDDKSRSTIEKMILEEQMYAYRSVSVKREQSPAGDKKKQSYVGRMSNASAKKSAPKAKKNQQLSLTHRKPWTMDEQDLFEQGLGMYGRSWTKIASMIDTRTALQVKNYAKQYFRQKTKALTKSQAIQGSIEVKSNDRLALVDVEDVVNENSILEDEQVVQSAFVSSPVDKDRPQSESDEDVEVDIDGSDNDEVNPCLIPGQTTSCPDAVYSALVRAAAVENQQDSLVDEGDFTSLEKNNVNDVIMDASTCLPEPEGSSSDILDVKEGPLIAVDIPAKEYDIPELPSSSLCQRTTDPRQESKIDKEIKSDMGHTDNLGYVFEDGCHFTQDYAQGSPPEDNHFPDDIRDKNLVLENTQCALNEYTTERPCEVVSGDKSTLDFVSVNNAPVAVIASSPQQPLPNDKDWAPVTCGETTSSEFIESSDREQPGASVSFDTSIVIDRNIIQDVEKEHNMEFFMGRALKTPERYMKIRNYILEMWEKTKPNFLFKTAVRSGLRNCGDVNSIGRVHAFLEDIGAINEGCLDRPVPRIREQGEVTNVKENFHMESWVNSLRPRKKRQRNVDGDWVDSSKAEGTTIQHLSPDEQVQEDEAHNEKGSPSVARKRPLRNKPSYDPFLLVPCRKFSTRSAVPFDVLIQSETLVVMDTHAHMSTTEVIGLLGGTYSHDSRNLKVSKAIPCRSLSTGLQCEMDPVSQTQASEELALRGLAVVGWYHSHPTFAPIPSVRDIETQAKFQEWFGKGGAPFIGIIVSPYNYSNVSNQSQIRCLTVSDDWESAGQYRLPYQFDYEVFRDEADEDDTVEQVRSIADDYRRYPFRVQLNRRFGASTSLDLLDKLLDSLRARINSTSDDKKEAFLHRLRSTISENIKPRAPIQDNEHGENYKSNKV